MSKIIFHIDVNSAYLSWTAIHRLQQGDTLDIRTIPSAIGGDELSRHGIVLAKSESAKKQGVTTGNSLREALARCPNLLIVPPDYSLYAKASQAMVTILREYSPKIQQFSVDECFLDYTNMQAIYGDPIKLAHTIKNRIRYELGFTVNIGISHNKLLAKMASDFKKPDNVHTLFSHEIEDKLWPLPVVELFMVGSKTRNKLLNLGIYTIGDLANADTTILSDYMKSHGLLVQSFARGIDHSTVKKSNFEVVKGIGNSTTIRFDVDNREVAYKVILSLCETVCMRLRASDFIAQLVSVSIVTAEFGYASHQRKLSFGTDSTSQIFQIATELFDELWSNEPIRKLGVRISELTDNDFTQLCVLETTIDLKERQKDHTIDTIRKKHGSNAVYRACFLHSGINPMSGGIGEEHYPVMTSIL